MQYNSPFNGCANGESNFPYVPISVPPVCARPHIVGEGDVASVTLPDGTLQLFFVPAPHTYLGSYLPWGAVPAWFIRTVPNLFAAPRPFATYHRDTGNAKSSNTFLFPNNAEESEEPIQYQLKFHNDKATSSTDIHYFIQPLQPIHPCSCHWKQSVETQVEPTVYYEVCCKACRCKTCGRPELRARESPMSVETTTEQDKETQSKTPDDKCFYKYNDKCNSKKCTSKLRGVFIKD